MRVARYVDIPWKEFFALSWPDRRFLYEAVRESARESTELSRRDEKEMG